MAPAVQVESGDFLEQAGTADVGGNVRVLLEDVGEVRRAISRRGRTSGAGGPRRVPAGGPGRIRQCTCPRPVRGPCAGARPSAACSRRRAGPRRTRDSGKSPAADFSNHRSRFATMKPSATSPRAKMTPRSTGGESLRPTLEPTRPPMSELTAMMATTVQLIRSNGKQQVGRRRDQVDAEHQDVLHRVGVLDGARHEDAEDADQQDPLGGDEVTAIDARQENEHHEEDAVVLVPERVLGVLFTVPHPALQPGLEHHHQQGQHNQHRRRVVEDFFRQMEQQPRAGDAAQQGRREQPQELTAAALQLAAVTPGARPRRRPRGPWRCSWTPSPARGPGRSAPGR